MLKKNILFSFVLSSIVSFDISANPLPIYRGDVLGRHLDVPGLGWIGHVGLASVNYWGAPDTRAVSQNVLEVLNEKRVIQINPINNFKGRSEYWGSRYIDFLGKRIGFLEEGYRQSRFRVLYTPTAKWWPAEKGRTGQFRCDTFVNYVYRAGGHRLGLNGIITPRRVFNAFSKGNLDGPLSGKKSSSIPFSSFASPTSNISFTSKELEGMALNQFISTIDLMAEQENQKTVGELWQLATNSNLSVDKKSYALEHLVFVAKIDMLPKLVALYQQERSSKLKSLLLKNIEAVYQQYPLDKTRKLNGHPKEKKLLQQFFARLLDRKNPDYDAEIIAAGFIAVHSNKDILKNIHKLNKLFDQLDPRTQIGFKTNLLQDIKALEEPYISEIIQLLNSQNDAWLDLRFSFYVVDHLSEHINAIRPYSKHLISNYLNTVRHKYDGSYRPMPNDRITYLNYGKWLESSALVNAATLEEARKYIVNFLSAKKNLDERRLYINALSKSSYMKKAFKTEPILLEFRANWEANGSQ